MDNLTQQFEEWLSSKKERPVISAGEVKKLLEEELTFLSKMNAEEYTLYRKWDEVNRKYTKKENPFFEETYPELEAVKEKIWIPESPEDYLKLNPVVIWTDGDKILTKEWNILRTFLSTMVNNSNIGRNIFFLVKDESTQKYLGVIGVTGDFMDLTPRDSFIGWSREIKTSQKMINHSAIGSSIVPTQPLGYNFLGGKLLALLTLSDVVENAWNSRYAEKLVSMTTTSLYGNKGVSQYDGLKPYWKNMGYSAGSIKFEPSKEAVRAVRDWMREEHPRRYWEWYHAKNEKNQPLKRDHKQRSLAFAYRQLGISNSLFETDHRRGIYYCPLFENTTAFLRKETTDPGKKRIDNRSEVLIDLWKRKYACKRVKSLLESGRYNTDTLFYTGLIGKTWEEAKELYLKDVGR
jgi:hypothetical protein